MARTIDTYVSLNSPWAYLGSARLEAMAARHGATIRIHPVDLGSIFPRSGGLPLPQRAPQRQAYRLAELKRWREFLGVPLNLQPKFFPAPDLDAACLVIAAGEAGGEPVRLAHAVLRAVWAEERNIADHATLEALAEETGHDKALLATALAPATRRKREAMTEAAYERGVFGSPTYIVDDELFWGQDRLDFVERALAR